MSEKKSAIKASVENFANVMTLSKELLDRGITLKISLSGNSMFPYLRKGDIALVKAVTPDEIEIGDVIVFQTPGKFIAHRLIRIINKNGEILVQSKGDSLYKPDPPVPIESLIGKIISIDRAKRTIDYIGTKQKKINRLLASISLYTPVLYKALRRIKLI